MNKTKTKTKTQLCNLEDKMEKKHQIFNTKIFFEIKKS